MNKTHLLFLIVCTIAPLGGASAQPSEKLPPNPPILPLPKSIQWERTPEQNGPRASEGKPSQSAEVTSILITKNRSTLRVGTTFSNDRKSDLWFSDNTFIIQKPSEGDGPVRVFDVDRDHPQVPIPVALGELQWVNQGNYVKLDTVDGIEAWHFQTKFTPTPSETDNSDGSPSELFQLEAWINVKTRLPIKFFDGKQAWRYEFYPFDGILTLPAALLKELKDFQERAKKSKELSSRVP